MPTRKPKNSVTVGRVTFVNRSGTAKLGNPPLAVSIVGGVAGITTIPEKNQGPYQYSDNWRTDKYFRLDLDINGTVLPAELHLYRVHTEKDRDVKGWGSGWIASIDINTSVGKRYGTDCLKCNGNHGRSGPVTDGETNLSVGPVIQSAMKSLGYEITGQYAGFGIFSTFQMRVEVLSDLGHKSGRNRMVGFKKRIVCPIHGQHDQTEWEAA
jgi:hypothetical protein